MLTGSYLLTKGKEEIASKEVVSLLSTKDYEDSFLTVLSCYLPDLCLEVCIVHYQVTCFIIPL